MPDPSAHPASSGLPWALLNRVICRLRGHDRDSVWSPFCKRCGIPVERRFVIWRCNECHYTLDDTYDQWAAGHEDDFGGSTPPECDGHSWDSVWHPSEPMERVVVWEAFDGA